MSVVSIKDSHLEDKDTAPKHKCRVRQFLSMSGSNCTPTTLTWIVSILFRKFHRFVFHCPPIKVVELFKVIKESSSRPALISGCKKGLIEEKLRVKLSMLPKKITGKTPEP